MRKSLLKRKIALGLSLLMLGSSEGVQVLAESVERESTMQAEESAWEEYSETSEQITEWDESKSGEEETTHQESTTIETIEQEAEATTMETATATEMETELSSEITSSVELETELSSEDTSQIEIDTEIESERESEYESETEELMSEGETEGDAYLADSLMYGDYQYQIEENGEATITKYYGTDEKVVVPDMIDGHVVTVLAAYAFLGNTSVKEIILPDNISKIGVSAFWDCSNLESLKLPKNLEDMGIDIINGTRIEKIVVPSKVTKAGYSTGYVSDGALGGCKALKTVIFEEGIKYIPAWICMNSKSIQTVILPRSVEAIEYLAFYNCIELKDVISSGEIASIVIGNNAFDGCKKLKQFLTPIKEMGWDVFRDCTSLEDVIFAEGIKVIGGFENCKSLRKIKLPKTLESIGGFENCGLESIIIPENVTDIGDKAFKGSSLKSVYFQNGKRVSVGISAFEKCTSLTEFRITGRDVDLKNYALLDCSSLSKIDSMYIRYWGVQVINGTQISEIIFNKNAGTQRNSFMYRGEYSFSGCDSLKTVIIEEGRTEIIAYAFLGCKTLEKIVIPESVKAISPWDFTAKVVIYGVPGSYAEEYAKIYNYQFRDVSEGFEDSYKTSEYLVKVIDSASKQPISGASICLNGEQVGTTLEDGTAKVTVYGTVTQSVTVTKDGYADYSSVGMPWRSTEQNIVELTVQEDAIKDQIMSMLPDVKLPQSTLNGPKITIFGNEVDLFSLPISAEIGLFDKVSFKYDDKKQTVKIMIGVKDSVKKEFERGDSADEKYKKIKNLVKACALGDNQSDTLDKFKDVKDDLEDTDTSVVFDVSGKITGFIEFKYENGQLNFLDGGLVTVLSAKASQKVPICYIFYSEFALSGTVTGTIKLTLNNQKMYEIIGSLELAVAPSIALGANALVVDVKGGFEGEIKGKLTFPAMTMEKAFEASMSGKLFIKVSSPIPFYTATFNWELFNIQLYPDFGANLEPVEWKMAVEDRVVPSDGQAYEYANTQIVTLSDGRSVKVYITDDGTKTTGNHTTLMYSICTNGVWSEAKPVCETGRADVKPVLRADCDKAYVVWMNIGRLIDASTTEEEIYQSTDLWFSEFEGETFKTPERVPADGNTKMEFSYDMSALNGTAAVVWLENSANDPFMQSGTNTIFSRQRVNGVWQDIQTMTASDMQIGALQSSVTADSLYVQYSDGTNLYQAVGQAASQIGMGSNVKIFDGTTYYIRDYQLYQLNQDGTENACGIACGSDYQVHNGVVYWTSQTSLTSELYMQKLGESNVVQLTYDNGYINSFAVCTLESGATSITYTWTEVLSDDELESPYGATYTKAINGTTVYDLACSGPSFEAEDIVAGQTAEFTVLIQNQSSESVNDVFLRVKDETETVLMDSMVLETIEAGDEKEVNFTYQLPQKLSGKKLTAEVYAKNITESDLTNNMCSCIFDDTDLSVSVEDHMITVLNHGYSDASGVLVEIRENGANGKTVFSKEIGTLAAGTSVEVEYAIPDEFLTFKLGESEKEFVVLVTSSTSESLFADNEATIRIEGTHIEAVELDQTNAMLNPGNTLQLQASLIGEETADHRIEWCSSNTGVVTVDQNGLVTALKSGQADVTVITLDGGYTAVCHVVVYDTFELMNLQFSKTKYQVVRGNELTIQCETKPALTKEQMLTAVWTSTDESVATVSNGVVTALQAGSTEIGVTLGGLTATCHVDVLTQMEITEIVSTAYNKLKINWTQASEANGYTIYRKNPETGKFDVLKNITDNVVVSYTNIVTCGTTYSYRIASYKLEGTKKVYLTESKIVKVTALPATPVLQSVDMAAYNKLRVTWNKISGCEGYVVYRSDAADGTYSVLKAITQASATNYVNIVKDSTMYYYKIRAFVTVNGKKIYGDYSNILSGNVISGPPQSFTISQASTGKITFTWNKVEDADGYVIYLYDPDTNKYKAIKSVADLDVLTYTKKMTKGATYHFAMRAYRLINGVKVYSDYGEIVSTK